MSDCSTEAMKPKEPPKTCGNCGLDDAIKHLDELLAKDEFPCDECRTDHEQLRGWLIELKSLEQRYQQLEQLSLDALAYLKKLGQVHLYLMYRENLEALGIEV